MTYRVSWDVHIDDATSPLDAARKAHAIICRPDTSADVYNVEAPDGVVTVVDLGEADQPSAVNRPTSLYQALKAAERFIAGFEDDALQQGVGRLLADIRAVLQGRSDRQIVDEANALAAADADLDRPPATRAANRVRKGLK